MFPILNMNVPGLPCDAPGTISGTAPGPTGKLGMEALSRFSSGDDPIADVTGIVADFYF
jgi:hypothetical protein